MGATALAIGGSALAG